ncbi:phosphoenolpyruvate synthase [Ferruginibacter sp. HRS2-29]|uniref:phosphoenolpyruvate synthase n=1 Tax=Ferruginibacter sp. HRS2-29 TaxID=2487334 RepID=UPI0020CEB24E|nr:phosphoenolpyruvate synthase [Ferruginibacter sp. HRS2-29]MCP9753158.1 phosphoenolpyruvate synthase [Ferruginibacter sp. HRS2-29]
MEKLIRKFSDIHISDVDIVGGKNASLGEMFSSLASKGIAVPDGFATTAAAFDLFLSHNGLANSIREYLRHLDRDDFSNLNDTGSRIRELLSDTILPERLMLSVKAAYRELCGNDDSAVAVRSSATAEDLPSASFAGQHDSFLNITGETALLEAIKKCYVSLYTNRAIKYREENGFDHLDVRLSVGVQKMVRSDKASSGVIFTLEPESGFKDIIHISGVWGLGENMVQGTVTPDTWMVFKPMLAAGKNAVIQKKRGAMETRMVYDDIHPNKIVSSELPQANRDSFTLSEAEVLQLAKWALDIEAHYHLPMDIEWAKDGISQQLYIIQARPETVHHGQNPLLVRQYHLSGKGTVLASGEAIGRSVRTGIARLVESPAMAGKLAPGDIIVTDITSPDWDPLLKRSGGIITNKGGRTSHAAIVAREAGVPAIVGCGNATTGITDGDTITIACCEGKTGHVYAGKIDYKETVTDLKGLTRPSSPKVMMIGSDPEKAFELSFFPNDGIGLLRLEFIIMHSIGIHPMALADFDNLKDAMVKDSINMMTNGEADKQVYFINRLAEGIAAFGAAFYPKEVIVRMSDFKTNEYAGLLGGKDFEPVEENPMIGFRGASRYYHPLYQKGFEMECRAVAKVRHEMGLENIKVMIPFCRTTGEAKKVIEVMGENGLVQGMHGLDIYMMAEIPANVILAKEFAELFDGFSIGSNDLTQLTLGIDRDSALLKELFSEENEAVKISIRQLIRAAHAAGKKIGLCGQAASDIPSFAAFLKEEGIDSISFNPDALLQGISLLNAASAESASVSHEKINSPEIPHHS